MKKALAQMAEHASSLANGARLPESFGFFDGRERDCLDYVRNVAERTPASVTQAIDDFCYKNKWMMNVGDVKGKLLQASLNRHEPRLVLELGTYVGYSALRMLQSLPSDSRIISVELSSRAAAIARAMFDHAGVSHRVVVVEGHLQDGGKTVKTLEQLHGLQPSAVDFIFLDHAKEAYLPDIQLILAKRWLKLNGVAFADNVLFPGAPDYREFMKHVEGSQFRTVETSTWVEYQDKVPDLVLESIYLGNSKM
jgi:catechol O-methyltransferase